jgi:hypothetical protein
MPIKETDMTNYSNDLADLQEKIYEVHAYIQNLRAVEVLSARDQGLLSKLAALCLDADSMLNDYTSEEEPVVAEFDEED